MQPQSANRQIAIGASWMVALRMVDRVIGFASTLILARILYPADYGLISLATGVTAILELVLAFSLDVALIQNPAPTRKHYDSAWTLNLIFASIVATGLIVLRTPASSFYNDQRVGDVMAWLALGAVFDGLANIRVVDFRRDLQFHKEFVISLTRRLTVFVVTLTCAFVLRNYWALLIGILTSKFVYLVLSYVMKPYRPSLSLAEQRSLLGFSKWILVYNILSYALQRGGEIALGRYVNQAATGMFSLAHELATLPTAELMAPVNRAALPVYSRLAKDLPELRKTYLDVLGLSILVTVPIAALLAAISDTLVPALLGDRWVEASMPLRILAIYSGLLALQTNANIVYAALGRTGITALITFMKAVCLVPLLILLVPRYGLVGAAWSYAISTAVSMPYTFMMLHRTLELGHTQFLTIVWRPVLAALVMYLVLPLLTGALGMAALGRNIAVVMLESALGTLLFVGVELALWAASGRPAGAEARAIRFARQALAKLAARARPG